MAQTGRLAQLLENLVLYFDLEELRTLCFDLGVDYDSLRGEGKESKARELLALLDRSGRIPEFIEACAKRRPNVAWHEIFTAVEAVPPFKGLQYFDESDADIFFGRELLTAQLVQRLTSPPTPLLRGEGRFLAIVGASGSGKSSIVRAGLVHALRRGEPLADGTLPPKGCTRWQYHIITPGAHPLKELAASLTTDSESVTATAMLMDDLARDACSLDLAVARLLKRTGGERLLLVVDQFEELFTACKDEAERKAFVDNLLHAAAPETQGATIVVIALRADFSPHCTQYANLRDALEKHQAYIGPMDANELRRAIEEPARRNSWKVEGALVDLILREVGHEPGALPLLSHALLETWKRRAGRMLTLIGYQDCGGVRGAIAKTAYGVYERLTPDQQQIARNIFVRLTGLGESTQDTRRRVALSELVSLPHDRPIIDSVIQQLANEHLITTSEGAVEVVHEALIREWSMLRPWLENREWLLIHRRLTEDAQGWQRSNRDESALYKDWWLARATAWTRDHMDQLNALEQEFLEASQELAKRKEAEREAQRQRELEVERKHSAQLRKWSGYLAAALGVVVLMVFIAGYLGTEATNRSIANATLAAQNAYIAGTAQASSTQAVAERDRAETQARIALSRQLAAQAMLHIQDQFDLSALLSMEARRVADTVEARSALLTGLQANPQLIRYLGYAATAVSVAFSPDGKMLASGSCSDYRGDACILGKVILWDVATGQKLGQPLTGHTDQVASVAFSPDSKMLASGSVDHTIILWDVANPAKGAQPLGQPLEGHTHWVESVAFSPDGVILASRDGDGSIILWNVADHKPIGLPLKRYRGAVHSVAFSPDSKMLASGNQEKTIILWDVANLAKGGQPFGQPLEGHAGPVLSVAFSPDGKTLASGGGDRTIMLWNVVDPAKGIRPHAPPLTGHASSVQSVAFAPGGRTLASGSTDHTIILWDLETRQPRGQPLKGHTAGVQSVAFSPDGKMLVSGGGSGLVKPKSDDNAIILWDIANSVQTGHPLGQPLTGHSSSVQSVTFSPDGKMLASGSEDTTILLWDVAIRQSLGQPLKGHAGGVRSVAFSPDSKILASGSEDSTIILWDVSNLSQGSQSLGQPLKGHTGSVLGVAFSPDGKILASGSGDRTIILWDAATRQPLSQTLKGHVDSVLGVAFSPDGKVLASGSWDKTLRLWNVAAHQPLGLPLEGHTVGVESVAFLPDGKMLASGDKHRTIILWDVANLSQGSRPLGQPLKGHVFPGSVLSVAFTPDGKILASGSKDKTIILWDVATHQPLGRPLKGHAGSVSSVVFSPDGKTLASGSMSPISDDAILLWDVSVEAWEARACRMANRNLTQEEWARYLPGQPYHRTCPDLLEGE